MMSHRLFLYYYICKYFLISSKKYRGFLFIVAFVIQENTKFWDIHALHEEHIIDYYYKLKVKVLKHMFLTMEKSLL